MSDKIKNIISNILGLIIAVVSPYLYIIDKIDLTKFSVLCVVGLVLFLFKNTRVKEFLTKFIENKLK